VSKRNKTLQQALLEARLAYSGDLQALGQQKTQTQRDYQSELANAAGTHRGIVASINAAKPELQKGYSQAEGTRAAAYNQVIPGLSKLSSVADAIKAGIIAESGSSKSLLGQARQGAFQDLTSRKIEAASGEAFARSNASRVLHTALADIGKQRGQTLHQRSLYAHKVYSDLLAAQAAALQQQAIASARNATQIRVAKLGLKGRRSAAHATVKAARIRAGAAAHKAGKPRAESVHSFGIKQQIDNVRSIIRQDRARGYSSARIVHEANTAKRPVQPIILNAAMDLEYHGGLSGSNRAPLQRAGVRIPGNWLHPSVFRPRAVRSPSFSR
jgi:hypothetical protein